MKHAFLIQAHHNPDYLVRLINWLDTPDHYIVVHIDKKAEYLLQHPDIKECGARNNILIFSSVTVNWGGASQIECMIQMFLKALSISQDINWFHHISGADIPLRIGIDFDSFFENSKYDGYFRISQKPIFVKNEIKRRLMIFRFNDMINMKGNSLKKQFYRFIEIIQLLLTKFLKVKIRNELNMKYAVGSNWFSCKRDILKYFIKFTEKVPWYRNRFNYTTCCDEVFFNTILINSEREWNICNTDLRYVEWNNLDEGELPPHTLNNSDFENLRQASNCLFARKIDPKKSEGLISLIETNLLNK